MDTQGGRLQITIGSTTFSCRGKATVKPARATADAGVNWNGKAFRTIKPQLASVDLSFDRGKGLPWDEGMLLGDQNVTVVEIDAGVSHYLTAAAMTGEPSIDTETGEVSGLSLKSDAYRQVRV